MQFSLSPEWVRPRPFTLVRQGENQCGQACVAMLTGLTLEHIIERMGKSGKTRTADLVTTLRSLGLTCPDRLSRSSTWHDPSILKFTHPDGQSHWVVWRRGKYYDPAAGVFQGEPPRYLSNSKVTSHLPVDIPGLRGIV